MSAADDTPAAEAPRLTEDQLIELRAWVGVKVRRLRQDLDAVVAISAELVAAGRFTSAPEIPQVTSARLRLEKWEQIYDGLAALHRYGDTRRQVDILVEHIIGREQKP